MRFSMPFGDVVVGCLRACIPAAGRGVGHRSRGHPELGQDDELEGEIASEDQQHDEQIVHDNILRTGGVRSYAL